MRIIWLLSGLTLVCWLALLAGYHHKISRRWSLTVAVVSMLVGGTFLLLAVLPGNSFYGPVLTTLPAKGKVVALTFDDGPYPPYTEAVLAVLQEEQVPATFFVVGENASLHPQIVREMVAAGHQVGTHTYHHVDLLRLSPQAVRAELAQGVAALTQITGQKPTLLRPPHGFKDYNVLQAAQELGLQVVNWSVIPRDWTNPGANVIVERVVSQVQPGSIVLLHDGDSPAKISSREQTVVALPLIIARLRAEGYSFVTVGQLQAKGV
ncbi:MAG: polysaccharide deacetylase family protein [Acidaminococcaceae bacterium]